jgi:tetratricopeptide (TPR) repeat protein
MRLTSCGLLAALLILSAGQARAAPRLATAADVRREVQAISELSKKTPVKVYDARAQAVLNAAAFAELEPPQRCAVYWMAGAIKAQLKDWQASADHYARATECPEMPKEAWSGRLDAALRASDTDGAAAAMQGILERFPDALTGFTDEAVVTVLGRVRGLPKGPQRQFALLDALFDAGWKPADPSIDLQNDWVTLAAGLVDRGLTIRAARVAQTIRDPWALTMMRADKRFDDLFDHAAPQFDPEVQSAVELEFRRKLVADHPDRLGYVIDYADDLIHHLQPDLALKLLDDAQAFIARAPTDKPAYSDLSEKAVWVKDYRRRALMQLGRIDEALAIEVEAAGEEERGGENVSQTINLAGLYAELGRPQEALTTLDRLKANASPYGLMQVEKIRAIACAELGDKDGLAKSLDYLRTHEADAPGALIVPLMWAGDLDAVAAVYIRRLADPDLRLDALSDMQLFALGLHPTVSAARLRARWDALRARPDIKAAVDKVGRVGRYSFVG